MRDKTLIVKVSENELGLIKERAKELGFSSVGEYIRYISMNTFEIKRSIKK
jgi:hypothetical protein